jgi:hypothetical protein
MAFRRSEIQTEHMATFSAPTFGSSRSQYRAIASYGFAEAFWARLEAYLDPRIRAGMSAFELLDEAAASLGLRRLEVDLRSGRWDTRNRTFVDANHWTADSG